MKGAAGGLRKPPRARSRGRRRAIPLGRRLRDVGHLLGEPAGARLPPNLRPLLLETPGTSSPSHLLRAALRGEPAGRPRGEKRAGARWPVRRRAEAFGLASGRHRDHQAFRRVTDSPTAPASRPSGASLFLGASSARVRRFDRAPRPHPPRGRFAPSAAPPLRRAAKAMAPRRHPSASPGIPPCPPHQLSSVPLIGAWRV